MMRSRNFFKLLITGIIILAVAVIAGSFSTAAPAGLNIAIFDMERIQNEFPDLVNWQKFYKDKDSEFNLFRGYLYQQQQNEINNLIAKANQQKNGKSAEEQTAIDKRVQEDKNKLTEELNKQLEQKRAEILKVLDEEKKLALANLDKIIAEIAKEKKYIIVIEKSPVHYGGEDITQLILDKAKKSNENASKKENKK